MTLGESPRAETRGGHDSASRRIYLFTGVFSSVLYTVLLVAPVIALPLITKYGLGPAQVGLLFSCELGAFSLTTVPAYFWLTRVPLRLAVTVCTVLVIAGNVASGFIPDFGALLVVRVVTSLAAGSITVVLLALGPRSANPGRAFGVFVVCQLAMGALILAVFPAIYANADVSAIYWTLAGLSVACLFFIPLLRGFDLSVDAGQVRRLDRSQVLPFAAGLVSIVLFYVGLSGIWSFMGQVSIGAGNSPGATSIVLSIATAAGIASALLATVLGENPRRRAFLLGGFVVMAGAVLVLLGGPALVRFAVAAILFKFGWTFVLPYLLSAMSALGGGPQVMNTANLMIGGGFALGPIVAGVLMQASGGFTSMIVVSAVSLVVALLCAMLLTRHPQLRPAGEAPRG
ncbi:MFS transporter [Rothia sp. AR01]|uniref:MFS transporter n=1 Tax=Rothia santali TaxID=2949643 RepID=A0A9X2KM93_9MICC|nr:MFS transporter [Rothia santali]MCP3426956.1 MFS transporter [Rothia santali]